MKLVIECEWREEPFESFLVAGKSVITRVHKSVHYQDGTPWVWGDKGQRFATRELAMAAVEKHHGVRRVEE